MKQLFEIFTHLKHSKTFLKETEMWFDSLTYLVNLIGKIVWYFIMIINILNKLV